MDFKVNIRARLQRHARNSHVVQKNGVFRLVRRFKVFSALIILILPFYPSFGAFGMDAQTAVGNYDESSILLAYQDDGAEASMFSQDTGFIKADTSMGDTRDSSGQNRLVPYTVEEGDSLSIIADRFDVSVSSIVWANNFDRNEVLSPGQVIQIPPVSGVMYKVLPGDTIASIATKLKVDAGKIALQNRLQEGDELIINQELVIPGGVRMNATKEETKIASKELVKKNATKKDTKSIITKKPPTSTIASKQYKVKYTGNARGFVWGNCTYFVASNKNVTWRGNANAWLRNAAAAGVPTGKTPAAGAIISLGGSGYNPYYGHVGIVDRVLDNEIIIRDMNYARLWQVTVRHISKNDPSIRGYIYAD